MSDIVKLNAYVDGLVAAVAGHERRIRDMEDKVYAKDPVTVDREKVQDALDFAKRYIDTQPKESAMSHVADLLHAALGEGGE